MHELGDIGKPAIYKVRVITTTHNSVSQLIRLHILFIEVSTGGKFTRYPHTLYDLSDFKNWRFSTKANSTDKVNYEEHKKHLEDSEASHVQRHGPALHSKTNEHGNHEIMLVDLRTIEYNTGVLGSTRFDATFGENPYVVSGFQRACRIW